MQIHYKPRCPVCVRCKKDPHFRKVLWDSKKYHKQDQNARSLADIGEQYGFTHRQLDNHCTQHQTLTLDKMTDAELTRLADRAEKVNVVIEQQHADAETVWDDVIGKGMEALKEGSMKLTANHLLKAAKDKSDFQIKKTGQKLAMLDMVAHFASGEYIGSTAYDERHIQGETTTDYDASEITSGGALQGAFGHSPVRDGAAGDAPAPRTSEVFEGEDI